MYSTGNPVPSSALEDMADNAQTFDALVTKTEGTTTDRLGRTRRVFQQILMDMGFQPLAGSFQTGATITARNQCLQYTSTGTFYSWNGALPKIVPAGSTPATSGGIGAGAWVDRTDVTLRDELNSTTGASAVRTSSGLSVQDTLNNLIDGQQSGVLVFQTYALLEAYTPANTLEQKGSFKVANDLDGTKNGYYSWVSGTTYIKDADLVVNTIDAENTSDAVSGAAVVKYEKRHITDLNWKSNYVFDLSAWEASEGSSYINGTVTIGASAASQSKLYTSTSTIGNSKYILVAHIENLQALHKNATQLIIYDYDKIIKTVPFNTDKKLFTTTFTASSRNLIQLYVDGNVHHGAVASGTPLISFDTNFVGFIPWTQEAEDYWATLADAYEGEEFVNRQVATAIKASFANNANHATTADNATLSFNQKAFFIPTDAKQLNPTEWTITTKGSTVDGEGNVVIMSDGVTNPKILIDNPTTIGKKYIALAYIDNPVANAAATRLRFYNYSQELFSLSLAESNFTYKVFTSSANGYIQVFPSNTTFLSAADVPNGSEICSFTSTCMAIVPWSEELEEVCSDARNNYAGGHLYFGKNLHSLKQFKFPDNSFNVVKSLSNRVKDEYVVGIPAWTSTSNSISSYHNTDGVTFTCGGSADLTAKPAARLWFGFDIQATNYATENKTYVVVFEGSITANNVDDLRFDQSSLSYQDITQDLENGVERQIKTMLEISYPAGYNFNGRYTYIIPTRKDNNVDVISYDASFTTFSLFEKIEGFTIDDYLNASKNGVIVPLHAKTGTATETYVNTQIASAVGTISKLSPNDLNPTYDIEMFLSGGQSLNVGNGAADASTDWKNTPSFALGNSLYSRAFTTQEDKDAFFGNEFSLMEDGFNQQYPPITASLVTMLDLLAKENKVNVSTFGYQMMPFCWGLSGSSITTMLKGTTAYSDMIECVTKAKEFANKEGKTFGVRAMNWYHGEADRLQTKQWYYDNMSQLFTDVNNDVKAITGQTEDIEFFSYQTSPWLGRDLGTGPMDNMDIQEAQVQVATDFDNVHICGAMYQFEYNGDYYHPVDRAIIGLQTGVALKRVLHDDEAWVDFKPISHQVITDGTNYYTHLKFSVPSKPMRFDESADLWHNPHGKQPNFGFELLSGGIEKQTAEPFIVKGDTVVLTSMEDPTGMTIRYAVNGHDGGGNLCDSQNIVIRNKNTDYVIDNFAVGFSEYIIS